jgi:rare lipoprotein A
MERKYYFHKGLVIALALLIGACGHQPQKNHAFFSKSPGAEEAADEDEDPNPDGPPDDDIDVTHIPNATPKLEPLSRYGNMSSYEVWGSRYKVMPHSKGYKAQGTASWYGKKFHGQRTSSGEKYDMYGMTAAHRSLPLPTYAKVKNLRNGKEVIVKINDRGPFVGDRLIDLSYAAAKKLGIHSAGTGKVQITAIDPSQWHKQNKAHDIKLAKAGNAKKTNNKTKATEQKLAKNTKSSTKPKAQLADASNVSKPKSAKSTKSPSKTTTASKANVKNTTVAKKEIFLQLATFKHKVNADKLAEKATTLTQVAANVKIQSDKSTDKSSYKVQIGPLKNETQAAELKKKLVALNGAKPKLIYE